MWWAAVAYRVRSCLQRCPREGPTKRFCEDGVEVGDDSKNLLLEVVKRKEAGPLEKSPSEDREPDLNLVEPRAVPWGVDESDTVGGILKKRPASLHGFQHASLPLDSKVTRDFASPRYHHDELLGDMRVELVGHKDPAALGIEVDCTIDMRNEIRFGARRQLHSSISDNYISPSASVPLRT